MTTTNQMNAALLDAVISNQPEQVKQLLEQGADPNFFEDEAQIRPLHFAAVYDSADVVSLLVLAGADIHATTEYHDTPLSVAKRHGHNKTLGALSKFYSSSVKDKEQ